MVSGLPSTTYLQKVFYVVRTVNVCIWIVKLQMNTSHKQVLCYLSLRFLLSEWDT